LLNNHADAPLGLAPWRSAPAGASEPVAFVEDFQVEETQMLEQDEDLAAQQDRPAAFAPAADRETEASPALFTVDTEDRSSTFNTSPPHQKPALHQRRTALKHTPSNPMNPVILSAP